MSASVFYYRWAAFFLAISLSIAFDSYLTWRAGKKRRKQLKDVQYAPNPFLNITPVNYYRLRYVYPGLFLIPIRLVLLLSTVAVCSLLGVIMGLGGRDIMQQRPHTGWRSVVAGTIRYLARLVLFLCGFQFIQRHGKYDASAPIVVANHRGMFEALYLLAYHKCCLVSAVENKFPVVGHAMDAMQFIFLDRTNPDSRKAVVETINRRANEVGWPQVAMFPEGTTTNGRALIQFKVGAFLAGQPVQPVAFEFPGVDVDPSYVFGVKGPVSGLGTIIMRLMSSWNNPMTVYYLPTAVPTAEEKKDAMLFANRVRRQIADALCIPCTEHAQEDVILATAAAKSKLPPGEGVVEFGKVKRLYQIDLPTAKKLLKKFSDLDVDKDGEVTVEQFADLLELPNGPILNSLFNAISNRHLSDRINFREFLAGIAQSSASMNTEEKVELCFETFDLDGNGDITFEELFTVMRLGFREITRQQVQELFARIDKGGTGSITMEDFKAFLAESKEHMLLFDMLRGEAELVLSNPELSHLDLTRRQSFLNRRHAFLHSKPGTPTTPASPFT